MHARVLSFYEWTAGLGALFLLIGFSSQYLKRLPISTSAVYLLVGFAIGPSALGWVSIDMAQSSPWLERVCEASLTVALFIGGLKMRLPLRDRAWSAAYRLAGPVMLVSILGLAACAHWFLGLAPSLALLLGAVLAPTDPVLAGAVSVSDAGDKDRMRFGLSGEAGFNDGSAFPFVYLALHDAQLSSPQFWLLDFGLRRILWAIPAGLALGFAFGRGVGMLAVLLRSRTRDASAPSDFLALALIALSYVGAELIGALGFLSVFAAGVGLRNAELWVVDRSPHPAANLEAGHGLSHPPAEELVAARVKEEAVKEPAVAAGVFVAETISFGDTVERLFELMLVTLVGIALSRYWSWQALPLALALFFLIRPLSTRFLLVRTPTTRRQRWLMGWFGIRGIGSLYYLAYALNHGLPRAAGERISSFTVSVVALSIVLHGVSAQPLLSYYERTLERAAGRLRRLRRRAA